MVRRLFAVLLALTFAVGNAPHSMQAPKMSPQTQDRGIETASEIGSDAPMSGKCNGCGHQDGAAAACAAFCAGMAALPAAAITFDPVAATTVRYAEPQPVSGRTEPPDPHPPRLTILS
jgi:hypothetical protein